MNKKTFSQLKLIIENAQRVILLAELNSVTKIVRNFGRKQIVVWTGETPKALTIEQWERFINRMDILVGGFENHFKSQMIGEDVAEYIPLGVA